MSRTNALAKAALAYAETGMPVLPAFPLTWSASGRRGPMGRRAWICGCSDPSCRAPGAHVARDANPSTCREDILATWNVARPPGLMLVPGGSVDVWEVGCEIGATAMRLLEGQRLSVWPPTMRLPNGRWVIITSPLPEGHPLTEADASVIRRRNHRTPLLVPPSRTPNGRLRWLWSPRFPKTPLPNPHVILGALMMASGHLGHRGAADDNRPDVVAGSPA